MCVHALPWLVVVVLLAQGASGAEEGASLFRAKCVACHGLQGNGGGGGVDLLRGKFKRPSSDSDILGYIRNGIPGTAMDKVNVTEIEASNILAYMRLSAQSQFADEVTGDPTRGKAIFEEKGGCLDCHAVRGNGSHFGPDLSEVGSSRSPAEIERSIIDPNAEIAPQNRIVQLVPRSGAPVIGRQLNQDTFTIEIIDTKGRLQTFERSSLRAVTVLLESPMPSQKGKLTASEIADLVAYLANLRGRTREAKR